MTDMKDTNSSKTGSNKGGIIILAIVAVVILGVLLSQCQNAAPASDGDNQNTETVAAIPVESPPPAVLPRLLDLGSLNCVPCKMMEPVLEELTEEYEGQLTVEFIDVRQNTAAAREHGIRSIPTQIFFDTSGTEVFRHVGFFAKEDILAKWSELGFDFEITSEI